MKKVRKALVVVMAIVLTLAMSITAFADAPAVKKFGKITCDKTMYTNGATDGVYEINYSYTYSSVDGYPAMLVTSSDRNILRITKIENKAGSGKITVKAVNNGKATITIADQYNKKKAKKVTITVKTLQSAVAFGSNVKVTGTDENGVMTAEVTVDAKGKANLGTTLDGNPTGKKVKYVPADTSSVSVTAKGVVTAKKAGETKVTVYANDDKKFNKDTKLAIVTVKAAKAANTDKPVVANGKSVNLKSNFEAKNHTVALSVSNYKPEELVFTSNKPAIAAVDPKTGVVTGVSNGKAVITVASKTNTKLAAKVTVKVTTDVDVITTAFKTATIVADGKSTLSILGATNKGASDAKVRYLLGTDENNTVNKIPGVSVSSKGIVKVKKSCTVKTFYVTVVTSKNTTYKQTVTINVVPAAAKTTEVKVADAKEAKATKKNTYEVVVPTNGVKVATLTVKTEGNDNAGVTWTNSKPVVADIKSADNGKTLTITAKAVGKTKLVATANDGSKKKVSITINVVKEAVAAGEINVYLKEKVQLPAGSWKVTPKEETENPKAVKISGGKLTGTKVGYVTISDGKTYYVVNVGPKPDVVQKNINKILTDAIKAENRDWMGASVALNAKTNAVNVTILNPDQDVTELRYTGASSYAPYILAEANKNDYMPKAIKVELGNGVVTEVKASADSVESCMVNAEGKEIVTKVVKTSDTSLTITENETAYPEVTTWVVEGLDVAGIKKKLETKDIDIIKKLAENARDYMDGVTVTKVGDDTPYRPDVNYDTKVVTVYHGTEVIFQEEYTDSTIVDRAWKAIKKEVSIDGSDFYTGNDFGKTLRHYIGKDAKVTLTIESKKVDYTFVYDVKSTMSAANYDALVDADIQTVLNITRDEQLDALTGIDCVAYDEAKNTFEITAGADMDFDDVYADLQKKVDAVVKAVNKTDVTMTFNDLQKVTASVAVPEMGQKIYEKNRNGITIDEFIKDFADTYYGEVASRADSYTDVHGAVSGFYATFVAGNTTYTNYYEVRFVVSPEAFKASYDKAIDAKLADAIKDAAKDAALADKGSVAYDAASNTLVATFNADATVGESKDEAVFNALKKAILEVVSKESVSGATLQVGKDSYTIKADTATNMANGVIKFLGEDKKISDLAKEDITLTVNYFVDKDTKYDLVYAIELAVDAPKTEDAPAEEADEDATVDEVTEDTTDDVVEEVAADEEVEVEVVDVIDEVEDIEVIDVIDEVEEVEAE